MAQKYGFDVVADILVLHLDVVVVDDPVLQELPAHRIGERGVLLFDLLIGERAFVVIFQPAFQKFVGKGDLVGLYQGLADGVEKDLIGLGDESR